MAPIAMTLSDLEGHFCCLKPFSLPCLGRYSTHWLWCVYTWTRENTWSEVSGLLKLDFSRS